MVVTEDVLAQDIAVVALVDDALGAERRNRVRDVDIPAVDRHPQPFGPAWLIDETQHFRSGASGISAGLPTVVTVTVDTA